MAENIFESVTKKYRGSPTMVVLFIAAFVMFMIGANHFVEDTYSSKIGLETLQSTFGLKVQIFDWTYWSMCLAPQIGSIIFFYMYLSNQDEKKYLWVSIGCQIADFFADSWYRSNGQLFDDPKVFLISSILTFVYFSVGSEVFTTIGLGLMLKIAAPAIQTWKVAWTDIGKAQKGTITLVGEGAVEAEVEGLSRNLSAMAEAVFLTMSQEAEAQSDASLSKNSIFPKNLTTGIQGSFR